MSSGGGSDSGTAEERYRELLIRIERKAQDDYDRTVIYLSGGALGISFAFVDNPISKPWTGQPLLVLAWMSWGTSVAMVLLSFFVGGMAVRKAIDQVDEGKIREVTPGGIYTGLTRFANASGGAGFLVGTILMALFVWINF